MEHDSENGWVQGEDESVIQALTIGVIRDLTCEIEGIERENPSMSQDEVLEVILSKNWYYVSKIPELPCWNDWFVIIAMQRVKEYFCREKYRLTEKEIKIVENVIYEMMDEFRSWKNSGGFYRHRIGYVNRKLRTT